MKLLLVVKMAAGMDVRDILELEGPEQQFITKDALMNDRKVHIQLFKKNSHQRSLNDIFDTYMFFGVIVLRVKPINTIAFSLSIIYLQ